MSYWSAEAWIGGYPLTGEFRGDRLEVLPDKRWLPAGLLSDRVIDLVSVLLVQ
jgi:hypothetical protein